MRALEWAFECSHPLWPASLNMPPTKLKLHKITQYLEKELARGRMIGPLPLTGRLGVHRHVEWGVLSLHHPLTPTTSLDLLSLLLNPKADWVLQHGAGSSALFSAGPRRVHPAGLQCSNETVLLVFCPIQGGIPFFGNRAPLIHLRSIPG